MLIDEVKVTLTAGNGGAGRVSFRKPPFKGPDGGNGGRGGDLIIKVVSDLTALRIFAHKKEISAEDGEVGGSNRSFGKDGKDLVIELPVGSVLTNVETGEVIELNNVGEEVLFCKGGLGGKGNFMFRSSTNTTPTYAQPGISGEKKDILITLKLIADFGLIGLPNAGKSSLLNELTAASVKVANYAFTTLEPNLGAFNKLILADIPGLIEGASAGKGLGIKFLKHIEKTKVLLHCISAESDDLARDYKTIREEMGKYNQDLLNKIEIILITKSDLVDKKDLESKIKILKKLKELKGKEIYSLSIYDYESVEKLKSVINSL